MKILPKFAPYRGMILGGYVAIVVISLGVIMMFLGCSKSGERKKNLNSIPVYEMGREFGYGDIVGQNGFQYIIVDNHEYLVFAKFHRFEMTHSPRCKCLEVYKNVH